ncbi:MAG: YCF48-related protein [Chloroflexota bacterium]|nr:YCF48-related protein [Chloroflexota bacterium]
MKKHEYDDLLPEEAENLEYIQQLEQAYQITPEDTQSIRRIRERWLKLHSSSRPLSTQETLHATAQETQKKGRIMETIPSHEAKPWIRRLNQMAAVLIVLLLVGTLVTVFALIHTDRSGKQPVSTNPIGTGHQAIKSGVVLTEGLRLYMVDQQVGWAVGVGPTSDNNYGSVLRTSDGGKHWKDVTPPGLPGHGVDYLYILDAQTVWLPVWQSGPVGQMATIKWLYRTFDAGASWQHFAWPGKGDNANSMTFIDRNHGWVVDTPLAFTTFPPQNNTPVAARKLTLLHTNDGGKTWQSVGLLTMPGGEDELQFHDQQTGWVTNQTGLYVTHDGGRSWQPQALLDAQGHREKVQPGTPARPMFLNEQTGYLLAGDNSSGGKWSVYMTQDGGQTWKVDGALPDVDIRALLDARHISGSGLDGSSNDIILLLTLTNGQWKITRLNQPSAQGGIVDFSFSSAQWGVALRQRANRSFDVYQTDDGGKSWRKVGSFPKGG